MQLIPRINVCKVCRVRQDSLKYNQNIFHSFPPRTQNQTVTRGTVTECFKLHYGYTKESIKPTSQTFPIHPPGVTRSIIRVSKNRSDLHFTIQRRLQSSQSTLSKDVTAEATIIFSVLQLYSVPGASWHVCGAVKISLPARYPSVTPKPPTIQPE